MKVFKSLNSITDKLSDNPLVYTYIRYLLTGDQKKMRMFIKKYLKKYGCKSIADVCCGTGDFATLTPREGTYIGWDINRSYIDFAKRRYNGDKNKLFIKVDVLKSKLEQKKYDCVWFISTMHHLSDDELKILLPRVKKIIGRVLIVTDIIPNPPHILQKFFTKIDRGKFVRPVDEKLKILEKYFKVVKKELISSGSVVQFCIICKNKNV